MHMEDIDNRVKSNAFGLKFASFFRRIYEMRKFLVLVSAVHGSVKKLTDTKDVEFTRLITMIVCRFNECLRIQC